MFNKSLFLEFFQKISKFRWVHGDPKKLSPKINLSHLLIFSIKVNEIWNIFSTIVYKDDIKITISPDVPVGL